MAVAAGHLDHDGGAPLGEVEEHAGEGRLLSGLLVERPLPGPRRRRLVDACLGQPPGEIAGQVVAAFRHPLTVGGSVRIRLQQQLRKGERVDHPSEDQRAGQPPDGPLLGHRDELLRLVEAAFPDTGIHVRGNEIAIDGAAAEQVGKVFEELVLLLQQGHPLEPAVLGRTIEMVQADERPSEVLTTEVLRSGRGRSVRPKSSGQKRYVDAIRDNVITFGIGPAGTGKSWLAVAMAVQALQAKEVERIILTRPAVEAGERLGFLPGDLMAKVDPYLRPLYDALYDMVEPEGAQRLLERGTVEVAPLAFMRGRAQPVDRRVLTPWGGGGSASSRSATSSSGPTAGRRSVLGVFPQGRREVFRVRTQDGAATLACAEHLWFVTTPDDRRHGKAGRVLQTRGDGRPTTPPPPAPVRAPARFAAGAVRAAAGPDGSVRARAPAR